MDRLNIKYIDEINSFHDWLLTNSISSSARLLWFALMHYCNKTGWKREFNVAISALELDTGLSKQSIIRARNSLQQSGRIIVRTRRGNQSSLYQIIPFAYLCGTQNDTQTDTLPDTQTDTQADTLPDTQADTIPRLDKTRLDKKLKARVRANKNRPEENHTGIASDIASVMQAYASNIHPVASDIEKDKLLDMTESYGPKACLKAIERAVMRNKRSLAYIQGILRNWQANGYDEADHAQEQKASEDTSQYDAIPF